MRGTKTPNFGKGMVIDMEGRTLGFIIWALCGASLVGLGIYSMIAKKEVAFSFWANAEVFPVNDVKRYNRAVGKLWIAFGIVFILLGIPLLDGQNKAGVIIPILGCMASSIVTMAIYVAVIEKKYRKKA